MKDRIKQIRKSLGLTQTEFANELGISMQAIGSYECGRRIPTTSAISLICEKFRVRREWLETGEGEMLYPPEDETAAIVGEILGSPENPLYEIILATVKTYMKLDRNDQQIIDNFVSELLQNAKKEDQAET